MTLTREEAFARRDSGERLTFFEAMEVKFWETVDRDLKDENGVVQPPEYVAPPPLNIEPRKKDMH